MNTYVNQAGGYASFSGGCGDYRLGRQSSVWRGTQLKTNEKAYQKLIAPEVLSGERANDLRRGERARECWRLPFPPRLRVAKMSSACNMLQVQ
jgi:hypothetical protein